MDKWALMYIFRLSCYIFCIVYYCNIVCLLSTVYHGETVLSDFPLSNLIFPNFLIENQMNL